MHASLMLGLIAGHPLLPRALEDANVLLSKKTVSKARISLVGLPPLTDITSSSCLGVMYTLYPGESSTFPV